MRIAYAGNETLYVPLEQFRLVRKYSGREGAVPKLSHLSGGDWQKKKAHIKERVNELADRLIALYGQRAKQTGYAFPPDDDLQKKFEDEFPYQLTADQARSLNEIKADMSITVPDATSPTGKKLLDQNASWNEVFRARVSDWATFDWVKAQAKTDTHFVETSFVNSDPYTASWWETWGPTIIELVLILLLGFFFFRMAFNSPVMSLLLYAAILLIAYFGAQLIVDHNGTELTTGGLTTLVSYVLQIMLAVMMISVRVFALPPP